LIDSSTATQNEQFRSYLKGLKVGWWHWLSNCWLVTDSLDLPDLSASALRDKVKNVYGGINCLVLELRGESDNDTWSGLGPKTEKKDMFRWLHDNW
jgi:hypothetical protein